MPAAKPVVVSTPYFRWAVIINAIICLAAFCGMAGVAVFVADPMNRQQENFFNVCDKAFMMTAGAFLGLLGGRAANPSSVS